MKTTSWKSFILLCAIFIPSLLFAVRPFVTDDARISDYGQLEFEAWSEWNKHAHGGHSTAQQVMGGVALNEWLQIITGGGVGKDEHGNTTTTDFIFQPKFLLTDAKEDGRPGIAIATGVKLPTGKGELSDDATGTFVVGILTTRLFDDWLLLHLNSGIRNVFLHGDRKDIFHWGVGIDAGVMREDIRYIAEMFSGDPFDTVTPKIAMQTGFRYLHSDNLIFDITLGIEPTRHDTMSFRRDREYTMQFGIRILFDAFTKEAQKSRPWGPTGLF